MAVLPAPLVSGQTDISNTPTNGNESSPSIAIDPTNPQHLVAVWTRSGFTPVLNQVRRTVTVQAAYSNNGGVSWTALAGSIRHARDFSQSPATLLTLFTQLTDASVGFDRNHNFYILYSAHNDTANNATPTAGELLLNRYNFCW